MRTQAQFPLIVRKSLLTHLIVNEPCDRRSNSEWQGAKTEEEADGLSSACRSADVEGDRAEHGDEAAVEDAHDQAEHHHRLVDWASEVRSHHKQHRAQPDGDEGDLGEKVELD